MRYVVVVFLFNLSLLASGTLDYCGARMCGYTNAHTFCQFAGGPGPQCIGYGEVPLTTEEKIKLVIRLNQRRAAVAQGRLRGFPTAGNMMKLMWMEELAREAQLWADQCEPPSTPEKNDVCRDLYSVGIGQCVASVIGEAPGLRPESMVDIWYMQNMFYRGNVSAYDPPVNNRYNYYGDFAQLAYSKTYMVGCGRSRFMVLISGRLRNVERLVCNFAPRGPNGGRPLWTVASPGSACPPRSLPDDNVPALCTVKWDLDETNHQDNVMSIEEHILLETVSEIERNESLNYIGGLDEMFLTKLAVATIGDVVTIPLDYTNLPTQNPFEQNEELNTNINYENIPSEIVKPITKIVLIGRPKTYKIEDLNEGHEIINNYPDTDMQDLPIKEKHFYVDYEFSDRNEERRTFTSTDITSTVNLAVSYIPTIQNVTENRNPPTQISNLYEEQITIKQETDTKEETIPSYSFEFTTFNPEINKKTKSDRYNESVTEIETDALLEEYLSDPDTVKRLQEELDRMEQALSEATTTTTTTTNSTTQTTSERADKVRRSLKDGIADREREEIDKPNSENSNRLIPNILQPFSRDENSSAANPVIIMTNDSKGGGATEGEAPRASRRANDDVKIEIGFGMPLGAMSAHPAFHSAWDIG
ncbi:hypothetical protein O0L34_g4513 [Tuta absoluta]|nr:hypothetical protein O0L34_g4513 [Tuta absoluta]